MINKCAVDKMCGIPAVTSRILLLKIAVFHRGLRWMFIFHDVNQGCQFCFGRCFVFSIRMECFSFKVFRRTVSELYCLYIYIYSTNIILKFKIFLNSQD